MRRHNKVGWLYDQVREQLNLTYNIEFDLVTQDAKKLDNGLLFFRDCVTDKEWQGSHILIGSNILITAVRYPRSVPAKWERDQATCERLAAWHRGPQTEHLEAATATLKAWQLAGLRRLELLLP